MKTDWTELIVSTPDGVVGSLWDVLRDSSASLAGLVSRNGAVAHWQGYFIAAPGEEPDWDTPRGDVGWEGFAEELRRARMREMNARRRYNL